MTREVLLLARWMAADLYLRDIDRLAAELSMQQASPQLLARVGDSAEPYRALLKQLRERLRVTRNWTHQALAGEVPAAEASWSTTATWSSRCNCATSRCTPAAWA